MSAAPWIRLLALGARERTLDEAVRASSFAELWTSTRAEVLLDVAHLAGLELDEVLVAAQSILDAPGHEGARRWAVAGREALRAGEPFAASYAFGRVLDALEVLADPQLAGRARKALELDAVAAALALGGAARVTPEDDLAHILASRPPSSLPGGESRRNASPRERTGR